MNRDLAKKTCKACERKVSVKGNGQSPPALIFVGHGSVAGAGSVRKCAGSGEKA